MQALRRSSSGSRCIHEHHCGSQASVNSTKANQPVHGLARETMELLPFRGDDPSTLPPVRDLNSSLRKKSWPSMKPGRMQGHHSAGDGALERQDRVMEEEEEEEEEGRYDVYVRGAGSRRGNYEMAQQRSLSMDFWEEKHNKHNNIFLLVPHSGGRTCIFTSTRNTVIPVLRCHQTVLLVQLFLSIMATQMFHIVTITNRSTQ